MVFVKISYGPRIHGMKTIAEMIKFDWGNYFDENEILMKAF